MRQIVLDTETTGLAGGTGTLAFLVGLAWWREGRFREVDPLLLHFGVVGALAFFFAFAQGPAPRCSRASTA